jgi:ribosomal protein S18 acetylase RimI-like enzyme
VGGAPVELRPTIDRGWLEKAQGADPLAHAYALWDLDRLPDRVRFVSAVRDEATVGYLLVWLGRPARPVVHGFGPSDAAPLLASALPDPPFVAVVPEEMEPAIRATRGRAEARAVLLLLRDRGPIAAARPPVGIRRLSRADRPALETWARRGADPSVAEYAVGDPDAELIWGAFEGPDLVGIAGASVRLPTIWVLAGVYVDPAARRRGIGRAIVREAIAAAEAAGVRVGLYVREDAAPARRLYESLGFRPAGRRLWLEFSGTPGPG